MEKSIERNGKKNHLVVKQWHFINLVQCHSDLNDLNCLCLELPELKWTLIEIYLLWLQYDTLRSVRQSQAQKLQALKLELLEKIKAILDFLGKYKGLI